MLAEHPTLRPTEIWVLLWSKSQCALHIETLDRTFCTNAAAFADDRRMDYVVIMAGDRELVDAFADRLRPTVNNRAEARNAADQTMVEQLLASGRHSSSEGLHG